VESQSNRETTSSQPSLNGTDPGPAWERKDARILGRLTEIDLRLGVLQLQGALIIGLILLASTGLYLQLRRMR
jgi:hypothetical protein